ncbi:YafY family transcriptional regulator [Paenibacillus sp. PR3]|uniref:YafY family transcriptional regulator n=1 Tax=Paenibacillus terricola TaxID=2763503 RepID=A0ABR8MVZ9_9BACL|nr:YafY family protein [Paenibacillus terricola]MBD3920127.1 YafY family transcriptional regulator [Paenibacillus terricola]
MRADRLLQIMLLLQSHGCLTSKALAAKLEVSERTIIRDMEALSAAGIPVYAERGSHGGWKLTEGYKTNWAGLNRDEIISLLASKPHRNISDLGWSPMFEAALLKLLASLSPTLRNDVSFMQERLYVDREGWHPTGEEVPLLPLIQEAVWAGRQLRIEYDSNTGSNGPRTVHPIGLVLKGSLWYLVALSITRHDRQAVDSSPPPTAPATYEPRTFRVARIRSAELQVEPAIRPDGFDLAAYWEQSVRRFRKDLPRYPARALVRTNASGRFNQTRFVRVTQWGEPTADGLWLEVALAFDTLESACEIALSFGINLLILEPEELRNAVVTRTKEVLEQYENIPPEH